MINSLIMLSHILFSFGLGLYNHGFFKCIEYQDQKQDVTNEYNMIKCLGYVQGHFSSCKRQPIQSCFSGKLHFSNISFFLVGFI